MQRRETVQFRLRWLGALILLMAVALAGFLMVRYYGVRAGWWATVIPHNPVTPRLQQAYVAAWSWVARLFA
jgi:hypothetical protein